MTIYETMLNRHSVRDYQDKSIDKDIFKGLMPFFAGFKRSSNYISLMRPVSGSLEEKAGASDNFIASSSDGT